MRNLYKDYIQQAIDAMENGLRNNDDFYMKSKEIIYLSKNFAIKLVPKEVKKIIKRYKKIYKKLEGE